MLAAPEHLLPWLTCTDYLTERLQARAGHTALRVLKEQWVVASQWDQDMLQMAPEQVWQRDILMMAHTVPCWFARTILPQATYAADPALFARLEFEPLGHLIFHGSALQRLALRHYPITAQSAEYHWLAGLDRMPARTLWLRLATFQLHDNPCLLLHLVEILLPGLEHYCL